MTNVLVALVACSSESEKSAEDGQAGEDAGADADTAPAVSRLSCGNVPMMPWDYYAEPAPDACKTVIEGSCCTQAEACAADAACMARMECLAACGKDWICRAGCMSETSQTITDYENCVSAPHPECLDLSCIGSAPPPALTETQKVKLRAQGFMHPTPLGGVSVHVCALEDLDCAHPLFDGTTKSDVDIDVEFPPGPTYVEFTGAGVYPTLYFYRRFDPHLVNLVTFTVPEPEAVSAINTLIGVQDDPTRGGITLELKDCFRAPTPGLHIASSAADDKTVKVYDVNSLPSATATMTDGAMLGGGFGNHPPGRTTITVTDGVTEAPYGTLDVIVRAGHTTIASIPPSL